jgi:hypothetical protein
MAELGADAGQQHAQLERLGDVVVGAGIQAEDRIGFGIGAGQHDDRRGDAIASQNTANFAPIHVRQSDIQQDQVVALGLAEIDRGGAVFGFGGAEFLMQAELLRQRLAQGAVIVDQQDPPFMGRPGAAARRRFSACDHGFTSTPRQKAIMSLMFAAAAEGSR